MTCTVNLLPAGTAVRSAFQCANQTTRYTYDSSGAPVSVQVGNDPSSAPRYWYVYNAHGEVVSLVDANGVSVASYSYDMWGNLLSSSERFTNGWTNPYRYDGRDGARYDTSDGLYWLAVRAYDPSIGRFVACFLACTALAS